MTRSAWLLLALVPLLLGCAALEGIAAGIAQAVRLTLEAIAWTLALVGAINAVVRWRRAAPVHALELVLATLVAALGIGLAVTVTESFTFVKDGPGWTLRLAAASAVSSGWLAVALGKRLQAVRPGLGALPGLAWAGYLALLIARMVDPAPPAPRFVVTELHSRLDGNACGRLKDGGVACWGRSTQAQRFATDPVKQFVSTRDLDCLLLDNGRLRCLGHDHRVLQPYDVDVDVVAAAGHGHRLCGATRAGHAVCWDYRTEHPDPPKGQPAPLVLHFQPAEPVVGLSEVVDLGLGDNHGCALRRNGEVWCWGRPTAALGPRAADADRRLPAPVQGLKSVEQLGCGEAFCCAREDAGTVRCWGTDEAGQHGDGDAKRAAGELAPVLGIEDAVQLEVGYWHACARLASGKVRCWGGNGWAQVGDANYPAKGNKVPRNKHFATPREIALPVAAADLQVSAAATCVRGKDGLLRCWGKHARDALRGKGKGKVGCDGGLIQPVVWCSDLPREVKPLRFRDLPGATPTARPRW